MTLPPALPSFKPGSASHSLWDAEPQDSVVVDLGLKLPQAKAALVRRATRNSRGLASGRFTEFIFHWPSLCC